MTTEPYASQLERSALPAPDGKFPISPLGPFGPSFHVGRRGRLIFRVIGALLPAGLLIGALAPYLLPAPQAASIANYVLLVLVMWFGFLGINLARAQRAIKPGEPDPGLYAAANMARIPRWIHLIVLIPSVAFVVLLVLVALGEIFVLGQQPSGAILGGIALFGTGSYVMYRLWRGP